MTEIHVGLFSSVHAMLLVQVALLERSISILLSAREREQPMDLAVRFPDQGRIHLESRFLFSEPHDPKCRQFLERVFQAPEITQITIKSQQGSSEVPRAELGYCPRTHTLKEVVDRVTRLLNPRKSRARQTKKSNGASSSNGHVAGANGHARSNGHVNGLNGHMQAQTDTSQERMATPAVNGYIDPARRPVSGSPALPTQKMQR